MYRTNCILFNYLETFSTFHYANTSYYKYIYISTTNVEVFVLVLYVQFSTYIN